MSEGMATTPLRRITEVDYVPNDTINNRITFLEDFVSPFPPPRPAFVPVHEAYHFVPCCCRVSLTFNSRIPFEVLLKH